MSDWKDRICLVARHGDDFYLSRNGGWMGFDGSKCFVLGVNDASEIAAGTVLEVNGLYAGTVVLKDCGRLYLKGASDEDIETIMADFMAHKQLVIKPDRYRTDKHSDMYDNSTWLERHRLFKRCFLEVPQAVGTSGGLRVYVGEPEKFEEMLQMFGNQLMYDLIQFGNKTYKMDDLVWMENKGYKYVFKPIN